MSSKKSLMMVTFNRLNLTKQTVDNIYNNTKDFNFIIVDNGSSDGTVEYLDNLVKEKDNITLFKYAENKGIAIGRNKCLKLAVDMGTEYFVTIDNDVLLPENWLEDCIEVLDKTPYGITGVNFERENFPIVNVNGVEVQHKEQGNIGTACKAFKKKLVNRVGYFTTMYGSYGEEDSDFSFRSRVAGFKIAYIKNRGVHLGEDVEDVGEYREFKDKCRQENLKTFYLNCGKYLRGEKSIYLPFSEIPIK